MYKTDYQKELQLQAPLEVALVKENAIITSVVASQKKYLLLKRAADIFFSFLFIVFILSWLLPIAAIWIILDSKGPVFFWQKRVGLNGKIFRCLKLRTMVQNDTADEKPAEENDKRITRAGKFFRSTNIDELPQLLNVLMGDMSLVGPRPHMIADCTRFASMIPSYHFRSLVKPGITGLAQVKGYHGPAKDYEGIANRYYWDAVYVRKASIITDGNILARTIAIGCKTFLHVCLGHKKNNKRS